MEKAENGLNTVTGHLRLVLTGTEGARLKKKKKTLLHSDRVKHRALKGRNLRERPESGKPPWRPSLAITDEIDRRS